MNKYVTLSIYCSTFVVAAVAFHDSRQTFSRWLTSPIINRPRQLFTVVCHAQMQYFTNTIQGFFFLIFYFYAISWFVFPLHYCEMSGHTCTGYELRWENKSTSFCPFHDSCLTTLFLLIVFLWAFSSTGIKRNSFGMLLILVDVLYTHKLLL